MTGGICRRLGHRIPPPVSRTRLVSPRDCAIVDSRPFRRSQDHSPTAIRGKTFSLGTASRKTFARPADAGLGHTRWFTARRVPVTRSKCAPTRPYGTASRHEQCHLSSLRAPNYFESKLLGFHCHQEARFIRSTIGFYKGFSGMPAARHRFSRGRG
jgi:hypothetical protein